MSKQVLFNILRAAVDTNSIRCRSEVSTQLIDSIIESRRNRALGSLIALVVSLAWGLLAPFEIGTRTATTIALYICLQLGLNLYFHNRAESRLQRAQRKAAVKRINRVLQLNRELREITGPGHEFVR